MYGKGVATVVGRWRKEIIVAFVAYDDDLGNKRKVAREDV